MQREPDETPDPQAIAFRLVDDPPGTLRLPGGLARYARGLHDSDPEKAAALIEDRARAVLAAIEAAPRHKVLPAVRIAQVVDHLAVRGERPSDIVLVALATAMAGNARARRWLVAILGMDAAAPLLGVSDRTLRRAKAGPVDDDGWRAFRTIAQGDLSEPALWAMVRALGLVAADPSSRKRGGKATLTRGAIQALHGGLDDPAPFMAASMMDAADSSDRVSIAAQAKAAGVDRATVRDWRTDPALATAYRLNQLHNAAWAKHKATGGAIQSVVLPPSEDPEADISAK